MKKIVIAFDGLNYSEGALNFALELHRKSPVFVTGVFIPEAYFANLWSYSVGVPGGIVLPFEEEESKELQQSEKRFAAFCEKNGMPFARHREYADFSIQTLVRETRYADLLVIGSEKFYQVMGTELNEYLKETLRETECPVVIVPEKFSFPQKQVLAFDGGASSVYAIKQFAYLFPELTSRETLVVYLNEKNSEIPDRERMDELLRQHFLQYSILSLPIDADKFFNTWMQEQEKPFLISGAFGRSAFSRAMRKSFVTDVLKEHRFPVFIAHR